MEKWDFTDVKTCLLTVPLTAEVNTLKLTQINTQSGIVVYDAVQEVACQYPVSSRVRGEPPARVTSCLPRSGCAARTVLTPCSGEQKLGAAASAQGRELGQAGPLFPPRGWPVPRGPGSTWELISNADSQVLPKNYKSEACISARASVTGLHT